VPPQLALGVLLAVDGMVIAAFLAAHVTSQQAGLDSVPEIFRLSARESLGSMLLFAKWLGTCVAFVSAARRSGLVWPRRLALLFLLLLLDDYGELHEFFGDMLADTLGLRDIYGLDADDLGEVLFLIPFGLLCFWLLRDALKRAGPVARPEVAVLLALLVALAFFGVVVDLMAQGARTEETGNDARLALALRVLEDGGEMVVGTLMLFQALRLVALVTSAPGPA
jgi:hypothetical protein